MSEIELSSVNAVGRFPEPGSDIEIADPLSKEPGTALDWSGLMALAEKHAVRYIKVSWRPM